MSNNKFRTEDPETIEIVDYVVGFLDILNQKHYLNRWGTEDDINNKRIESLEAIGKTLGTVHELRKMVTSFNTKYNAATPVPSKLRISHPKKTETYERTANSRLESFAITDTVVFFAPANLEDGVAHMKSIFGIMFGMAATHFHCLSNGVATRGSIEIGLGCNDLYADLYGPCIASAYQLESECAQYPRIVCGDGLTRFLDKTQTETKDPQISPINRNIAGFAKKFLTVDSDGNTIVDFAGEGMASLAIELQPDELARHLFRDQFVKMRSFTSSSLKQFEGSNNKLHARYQMLDKYLESNRSHWE